MQNNSIAILFNSAAVYLGKLNPAMVSANFVHCILSMLQTYIEAKIQISLNTPIYNAKLLIHITAFMNRQKNRKSNINSYARYTLVRNY